MSGGGQQRDDIAYGRSRSEKLTREGLGMYDPYVSQGLQANALLGSAFGLNRNPQAAQMGPGAMGASDAMRTGDINRTQAYAAPQSGSANDAYAAFQASPFYQGGALAFNEDRNAVDQAFSNMGGLYSGGRLEAVEDVRNRNFQNSFNQFLGGVQGLSNQGFATTDARAQLLNAQANREIGAAGQTASTRQGVLGTAQQAAGLANQFG
ncbi:MAG: hypothetical protein AAFR11_05630 [Pseudomonadota bacterium]